MGRIIIATERSAVRMVIREKAVQEIAIGMTASRVVIGGKVLREIATGR